MFILKGYVVYIFIWSLIFNMYVFITTLDKNKQKKITIYYKNLQIVSCFLAILFSVVILATLLAVPAFAAVSPEGEVIEDDDSDPIQRF